MQLEEDICAEFFKKISDLILHKQLSEFDVFCISNNQRGNSVIRQAMDKRLGVTKGVADYRVMGVGYLEAKRIERKNKNGTIAISKQTPEQKAFEARCKQLGEKYATFYTADMGVDIALQWIKERDAVKSFIPASEVFRRVAVAPI